MIRLILKTAEAGDLERSFDLPVVSIGRGAGADLRIADPRISSIHGEVVASGGRYRFRDLKSTNGSMVRRGDERFVVDGARVPEVELCDGDEILLGDVADPVVLMVLLPEPPTDEVTPAPPRSAETVIAERAMAELPDLDPQARREAVARLLRFLNELAGEPDREALWSRSADFLLEALPAATDVAIFGPAVGAGKEREPVLARTRSARAEVRPSRTLLDKAVEQRTALLVEDLGELKPTSRSLSQIGARTALCAPLLAADETLGALQVFCSGTGRFDQSDLDLLALVAHHISGLLRTAELVARLREAEARLEARCEHLAEELEARDPTPDIIGESPALKEVFRQVDAVAPTGTSVLLLGDTGTGKELVAKRIHERSPRAEQIFAAVNCGAITPTLLESELFGHLRGAFTGAVKDKKGLFEIADGGTLFLDEIGEMSLELQVKLLRALQEGEVTPVGATTPRLVDVRVIAATNRDLEGAVTEKRFREDLYYRINVFPIRLPPLRDRGRDAVLIAEHWLCCLEDRNRKGISGLSEECKAALAGQSWPGNVRELLNEVERAYLMANPGGPITAADLGSSISSSTPAGATGGSLKEILERYEAEVIRAALAEHDGNRTHTARALGISRQALITKLNKFSIT